MRVWYNSPMDALIIFCAKYLIFIIATVAFAGILFVQDWKRYGLLIFGSLAISLAVGKGLGLLWYDTLPFVQNGTTPLIAHAANNGFPSDHMLLAAALASAVFLYSRTAGVVLWLSALCVGVSRVLAGVHHPIDIIAAALVAIAAVAAADWCIRRFLPVPTS
jgi:undecaprenyl-diphosphatase